MDALQVRLGYRPFEHLAENQCEEIAMGDESQRGCVGFAVNERVGRRQTVQLECPLQCAACARKVEYQPVGLCEFPQRYSLGKGMSSPSDDNQFRLYQRFKLEPRFI